MEASITLFHCHAGERDSGGNVWWRQWACLYFNQGDLVRNWSKPSEALLDDFDFRRCSFSYSSSRFDFEAIGNRRSDAHFASLFYMHLVLDECRLALILYRLYLAWLKRCAGAASSFAA